MELRDARFQFTRSTHPCQFSQGQVVAVQIVEDQESFHAYPVVDHETSTTPRGPAVGLAVSYWETAPQ